MTDDPTTALAAIIQGEAGGEGGSPDFTQAIGFPHGWYSSNPSPSTDPNADVTVRGNTINIRTLTSILHSIGGALTGQFKSQVTGGITRIIDALGHHTSAPNATVDVTTQTTTHTSSGSHTDTAVEGISHVATGQNANVSATAQKGNITHTAAKGSIVNEATLGAINNSAMTMQLSSPTLVEIT